MVSQAVCFFNSRNFSSSIMLSECSRIYLHLQQDESLCTDYDLIAYIGLNLYHHLPPCWNCTRAFKNCSHLMVIWFFPCQKTILKPTECFRGAIIECLQQRTGKHLWMEVSAGVTKSAKDCCSSAFIKQKQQNFTNCRMGNLVKRFLNFASSLPQYLRLMYYKPYKITLLETMIQAALSDFVFKGLEDNSPNALLDTMA